MDNYLEVTSPLETRQYACDWRVRAIWSPDSELRLRFMYRSGSEWKKAKGPVKLTLNDLMRVSEDLKILHDAVKKERDAGQSAV